ncbi:MAG: hypothetical protein U0796_23690 [Gemmatales bacterium]
MKTLVTTLIALVIMCGLTKQSYSQEIVSHEVFWELQLEDRDVNTLTDREIARLSEESARTLLKSSLPLVKKINALGENRGVTIIGTVHGHTLVVPKGTLQFVPKVISRAKGSIQSAGKDDLVALLNPGMLLDAPGAPFTWTKFYSGIEAPRGDVLADKLTPEASEHFIVTVLPNNHLAIRAHTGYLIPDKSGAGNVAANSTVQQSNWELETHADSSVSLKRLGLDGKYWYLSADADQRTGTPPMVRADRDKVTNSEKFLFEFKDGFVRIKSVSSDRYLSVSE